MRGCGIARIEFQLVPVRVAGLVVEIAEQLVTGDEEPLPGEALMRVPFSLSCSP